MLLKVMTNLKVYRTVNIALLCIGYSILCQKCLGILISLMMISQRKVISCFTASRKTGLQSPWTPMIKSMCNK